MFFFKNIKFFFRQSQERILYEFYKMGLKIESNGILLRNSKVKIWQIFWQLKVLTKKNIILFIA
jgi:hypothetical protein